MKAKNGCDRRIKRQNRKWLLTLLTAMFLGCALILGACVAQGTGPEQTQSTEQDTAPVQSSVPPESSAKPTEAPTESRAETEAPTESASESTQATEPPTTAPTTPPTTSPATAPTTAPTEAPPDDPDVPREELLVLVNFAHSVPEDWTVDLVKLKNGQKIDSRAYPSLQRMMADCRAAGRAPIITSGYRANAYQAELFEKRTQKNMDSGMSREEAEQVAALWVARPGTSEHELGFAIDIGGNTWADAIAAREWFKVNSWRYGWILRYPDGKTDITGIGYEDWHYRYVGVEAAKEIHESGLCLEEYLGILD